MRGTRGGRAWRRRALALAAALLLGWAALPDEPASVRHDHRFPGVPPDALAHYLADFSNQILVYPHPESWTVEAEWNNGTWWRYEVSYACGARCVGRAAVTAASPPGGAHRVRALHAHCTRPLPPLPWPALCEETETESVVAAEGAGSRLTERAAVRCSPLARCAGAAELAARQRLRLRALAAALGPAH